MSSRIEQIIGEIEEYVDSCKFQPLSTTKIVVNKEEIEELLRELRLKLQQISLRMVFSLQVVHQISAILKNYLRLKQELKPD